MPSRFESLPITKQQLLIGGVVLIALIAAIFYWYSEKSPESGKSAAEQTAENVAKSENPFESDSALAEVEADPLAKTKAVLNPF